MVDGVLVSNRELDNVNAAKVPLHGFVGTLLSQLNLTWLIRTFIEPGGCARGILFVVRGVSGASWLED